MQLGPLPPPLTPLLTMTAVKPDLPYVILTKLVIASSPRKMLTLNQVCVVTAPSAPWLPLRVCVYAADAQQIYQAMEERWPYFKKLGQTFRVSRLDRHTERPLYSKVWRSTARLGPKHFSTIVPSALPPKEGSVR